MAKWILYKNSRSHLTLLYKNLVNGSVHNCGELRADTPATMILDWVLKQAATAPGDFIAFPDGTIVPLLQQAQA